MKYIFVLTVVSFFASVATAEDSSNKSTSPMDGLLSKATEAASQLDWSTLSWDAVSSIPYDRKGELVGWAMEKVDTWKGALVEAAKEEGLSAVANLNNAGWQGYLKKVVDAVNVVKESNPETYAASKKALVGAWTAFEKEAWSYLKKE